MPLHACSTQRGEGGGEGRREREGEEERGGRLSQPPRHSPSLPFPLALSVVQSLPLGCTHTQAHGVCVRVRVWERALLPVVAYLPASLFVVVFSPLSPALVPSATFLLTSGSAWKEVKGKRVRSRKEALFSARPSSSQQAHVKLLATARTEAGWASSSCRPGRRRRWMKSAEPN